MNYLKLLILMHKNVCINLMHLKSTIVNKNTCITMKHQGLQINYIFKSIVVEMVQFIPLKDSI
jgi:hypothetical protein